MKKSLIVLFLSISLLLSSCVSASNLNSSPIVTTAASIFPTTATSSTTILPKTPSFRGIYSLITEPEDGVTPVINMIQGATKSIDLVMYELYDQQIENALISAENHSIAVRVLLNEGENGAAPSSENETAYQTLQSGGVPVHWAPTYFALTHQKTLIVDGNSALIMTFNFTPEYYSTSRDFGIVDNDPADISVIETTFGHDWQGIKITAPMGDDLFWSPGADATILVAINNSKSSLYVENEEMSDTAVVNALVTAEKRGVNVEVVMTEQSEWDANFTILRSAGIGVRTYAANALLYIHAKMILVDGTSALVGSQNFSNASLDNNRELGITVIAPSILNSLFTSFQNDWNGASIVSPATTTSTTLASASAAFLFQVVSVTSPVSPGADVTLIAKTIPGAQCTITVNYKSGPSTASGLETKMADSSGNVSWTWAVGKSTTAGIWPIVITATSQGNTVMVNTSFMVD